MCSSQLDIPSNKADYRNFIFSPEPFTKINFNGHFFWIGDNTTESIILTQGIVFIAFVSSVSAHRSRSHTYFSVTSVISHLNLPSTFLSGRGHRLWWNTPSRVASMLRRCDVVFFCRCFSVFCLMLLGFASQGHQVLILVQKVSIVLTVLSSTVQPSSNITNAVLAAATTQLLLQYTTIHTQLFIFSNHSSSNRPLCCGSVCPACSKH